MIDADDPTEELTAFESAVHGWDRWAMLRDSDDNVRPLTPKERKDLDALLATDPADTVARYLDSPELHATLLLAVSQPPCIDPKAEVARLLVYLRGVNDARLER